MTRPLRPIEKETRILGIDECNRDIILGVVVRGGLYMDGIMRFQRDLQDPSIGLARRITKSPYFPELRAIMLHDPYNASDFTSLEKITNLPTVAVSDTKPHGRYYSSLGGNLGSVWVGTALETTALKKLVGACWRFGELPEPLRLAHLLARQISRKPRDKE